MPVTQNAQQSPADVAVVMPTTLRPSLLRAARSVFRQEFGGRIQLLIGIDVRQGDATLLQVLQAECPPHVSLTVMDLGYSTAARHGGLYPNAYSGGLRTLLSYAANSRRVAYLDDDDWYAPMHLAMLYHALDGKQWAYSQRWLVDAVTGWPICPDEWDSVGVDAGINQERFGGFVHPSTLMLDKLACHFVLPHWSNAMFSDGGGEDRLVFQALRSDFAWGAVPHATSFCTMSPESLQHAHHAQELERRNLRWVGNPQLVAQLVSLLRQADAKLAVGDAAGAADACHAALLIHASHAGALRRLGQARQAMGDAEGAGLPLAQAALLEFGLDDL